MFFLHFAKCHLRSIFVRFTAALAQNLKSLWNNSTQLIYPLNTQTLSVNIGQAAVWPKCYPTIPPPWAVTTSSRNYWILVSQFLVLGKVCNYYMESRRATFRTKISFRSTLKCCWANFYLFFVRFLEFGLGFGFGVSLIN